MKSAAKPLPFKVSFPFGQPKSRFNEYILSVGHVDNRLYHISCDTILSPIDPNAK